MPPLRSSAPLVLVVLLLAACASTPREANRAPKPVADTPASVPANRNLRRGMTEQEIRSVWGEPIAVHAGKTPGESILVYRFDVLTTQRMVATGVDHIPAVDPVSGVPRTVLDPVFSPQQVTVVQTIVLQLQDGKLASWARQLGEQRRFD